MAERFTIVKRGGYNPTEVDNFIASLEDVIRGYKEKDAAINNLLLNAQIAADNITKNAELEVVNSKQKAVAQLDKIVRSVEKQRNLLECFKTDYKKLIGTYLKEVEEHDFAPISDQITELEQYLESLKKSDQKSGKSAAEQTNDNFYGGSYGENYLESYAANYSYKQD